MKKIKAILMLEDGTSFEGYSFGSDGEKIGEVVFNTSITGYQEILTDPSYCGQIVVMTYPLIGNYGVNEEDIESKKVQVEGFVVKELSRTASNYRATKSLDEYLKENKIVGIEGIDTRTLTLHLRNFGAMKGVISTIDFNKKRLLLKLKEAPSIAGRDLVKYVTCKKPYKWNLEGEQWIKGKGQFRVVAIDCGIKLNILRHLANLNCEILVVPAKTKSDEILKLKPDGIFLSNGPGDPQGVPYVIETVRQLIEKKPIFGICLGHQILGLAFGCKVWKLKFGHHGGNHPVKNLQINKIEITAQNHNFAIDIDSLKNKDIDLTHINLYDKTMEGIAHKKFPIFSVQYHPEASPGPHDSSYLFEKFVENMKNYA